MILPTRIVSTLPTRRLWGDGMFVENNYCIFMSHITSVALLSSSWLFQLILQLSVWEHQVFSQKNCKRNQFSVPGRVISFSLCVFCFFPRLFCTEILFLLLLFHLDWTMRAVSTVSKLNIKASNNERTGRGCCLRVGFAIGILVQSSFKLSFAEHLGTKSLKSEPFSVS